MQPFQRNFSRTYKLHCILNSRLCNNNNSNNNLNSLTTTTIIRRNIITVEKNNQNKPKYYSSVFTFLSFNHHYPIVCLFEKLVIEPNGAYE